MRGGDGVANCGAPSLGSVGADEFLLGEAKGLGHGLADVGQGVGGFVFEVTLCDGGKELAHRGSQVAGCDEVMRKRRGEGAANTLRGDGLRFLASVKSAEMSVRWREQHAATAAVGEGETAGGVATLGNGGHGSSCWKDVIREPCSVAREGTVDRRRLDWIFDGSDDK